MPKDVSKQVFNRFKKYYEPDVFREAGKRIREMARAADKFTIEERIERISAIFNTFRNPDKETVLTPWRVVNMHMSDCLGGYCFYDEEFKHPISVPRYVNQGKVTSDVFRPDSHILEINSKSGLYPLYVAYSVYRARVEAAKARYGEVNHAFAMSLWDATIEENILVVCKTPMAKSITKRTLVGFRNTRVNACYYKNLIKEITERPEVVVNTLRDGRRFWNINDKFNMKLDAIVGNPPYQEMDGGNSASAKPLYHKFVYLGKALMPNYLSMIMPSRWFAGGRNLDDFRNMMLNDNSIKLLSDFPNGKSCFPNTYIAGGICYFLRDKSYHGYCTVKNTFKDTESFSVRSLNEFDVFIRLNGALSIVKKVLSMNEQKLVDLVSAQRPYGLRTFYRGQDESKENNIRLFSSGGISYIKREDVTALQEHVDKYKVILSRADSGHPIEEVSEGKLANVICQGKVLCPKEVCTETWLSIGAFETQDEAENLLKYLNSRFVRFLLLQALTSIMVTNTMFQFVPLQDFTKSWTDEELYAKYGLTEEEIAFIESMIKPME